MHSIEGVGKVLYTTRAYFMPLMHKSPSQSIELQNVHIFNESKLCEFFQLSFYNGFENLAHYTYIAISKIKEAILIIEKEIIATRFFDFLVHHGTYYVVHKVKCYHLIVSKQ